MSSNPSVRVLLEARIKDLGYKKHGPSWIHETDGVVRIMNVQRSRFAPQYWLNLGLFFRQITDASVPKQPERAHLSVRAEASDPRRNMFIDALDEESAMDIEEREKLVSTLVTEVSDEFFNAYGDLAKALQYAHSPENWKNSISMSIEFGDYAGLKSRKPPYLD